MSVDTTKDPIYQTLQGVWDCLRANTTLTTYIPTKNQVDYTSDVRSPQKPGLLTADVPQMRVVWSGLKVQIPNTSSTCNLLIEVGIEIMAGDKRSEKLTRVVWEIYQAMSHYRTYIFDAVTYNGEYCVKRMMPVEVDIDLIEKSDMPVPAGWKSVWKSAFELFITTNTVKA
jgi:hypothetical protein